MLPPGTVEGDILEHGTCFLFPPPLCRTSKNKELKGVRTKEPLSHFAKSHPNPSRESWKNAESTLTPVEQGRACWNLERTGEASSLFPLFFPRGSGTQPTTQRRRERISRRGEKRLAGLKSKAKKVCAKRSQEEENACAHSSFPFLRT